MIHTREQCRQLEIGRACWLADAKHTLAAIGLGDCWDREVRNEREERVILTSIEARLRDINFQEQLSVAENLPSMRHLKYFVLGTEGIEKIIAGHDRKRTRALAQLVLNCPGSLVQREGRFIFCGICSSPLPERNVFIHIYTECVNTDVNIKRFYSEKIATSGSLHLRYSRLTTLAIESGKIIFPAG